MPPKEGPPERGQADELIVRRAPCGLTTPLCEGHGQQRSIARPARVCQELRKASLRSVPLGKASLQGPGRALRATRCGPRAGDCGSGKGPATAEAFSLDNVAAGQQAGRIVRSCGALAARRSWRTTLRATHRCAGAPGWPRRPRTRRAPSKGGARCARFDGGGARTRACAPCAVRGAVLGPTDEAGHRLGQNHIKRSHATLSMRTAGGATASAPRPGDPRLRGRLRRLLQARGRRARAPRRPGLPAPGEPNATSLHGASRPGPWSTSAPAKRRPSAGYGRLRLRRGPTSQRRGCIPRGVTTTWAGCNSTAHRQRRPAEWGRLASWR